MLVTKQLLVAIDIHSIFSSMLWKTMTTVNCLLTILQNILFCAQQKKETLMGLEQLKDE